MFKGKSPSINDFPTGDNFQPLGKVICDGINWAFNNNVKHTVINSKICFFIANPVFSNTKLRIISQHNLVMAFGEIIKSLNYSE
jgi:hypothetical protein